MLLAKLSALCKPSANSSVFNDSSLPRCVFAWELKILVLVIRLTCNIICWASYGRSSSTCVALSFIPYSQIVSTSQSSHRVWPTNFLQCLSHLFTSTWMLGKMHNCARYILSFTGSWSRSFTILDFVKFLTIYKCCITYAWCAIRIWLYRHHQIC